MKSKLLLFLLFIAGFFSGILVKGLFTPSTIQRNTETIAFTNINEDGTFVMTGDGVVKEFTKEKNLKIHWYTDPYCPDCIRTHTKTDDFLRQELKDKKIEIMYHPLNFLSNKTITNYSLKSSAWIAGIADKSPNKVMDFMKKLYDLEIRDSLKDSVEDEDFYKIALSIGVLRADTDFILTNMKSYKEAVNLGSNGLRTNKELTSKTSDGRFFVPFIYEEGTNDVLFGEEENTEEYVVNPLKEKLQNSTFGCDVDCKE